MQVQYNDGGRHHYFTAKNVGDCVCRAICIALEKNYLEIYGMINAMSKKNEGKLRARNGVYKKTWQDVKDYLISQGWQWTPTAGIGQRERLKLNDSFPKSGTFICQVSKHLTVVKDGVIHDTHDCSRGGNRMVYGYFTKKS